MKAIVLGASGMLGSMVLDTLRREPGLQVAATARDAGLISHFQAASPGVEWHSLDASTCDVAEIIAIIKGASWVVNCIGVIKPYIHDDDPAEIERAIRVNSLFPQLLAHAAEEGDAQVLQIATDCVYSGAQGNYREPDKHDALDVYGKTKSLGEAFADRVHNLRCSIIGPEPKSHVSLLDWFLNQSSGSAVSGYVNHQWNGVTTLHFARLCLGVITKGLQLPHLQHVVPEGRVSKAELLSSFAREFKREDITINPGHAEVVIDRTLLTNNQTLNQELWSHAGYVTPPSVAQMVAELAAFDYSFRNLGEAKQHS